MKLFCVFPLYIGVNLIPQRLNNAWGAVNTRLCIGKGMAMDFVCSHHLFIWPQVRNHGPRLGTTCTQLCSRNSRANAEKIWLN